MRAQQLRSPAPVGHPTAPSRRPPRARTRARGGSRARHACGCCRTDLHVVEGDLELTAPAGGARPPGRRPGRRARRRVARCWRSATASVCRGSTTPAASATFCRRGEENLCERARFTGWTVDGGYAEAMTVPEAFAVRLPDGDGRPRGRAAAVRRRDRLPGAAARRGAAGRARRAPRASVRRRTSRCRCCTTGGARPSCSRVASATASSRASSARRGSGTRAEVPPGVVRPRGGVRARG